MSPTKKAFIWISIIAVTIFTLFAVTLGSIIVEASHRNTPDLFFMFIWLTVFLICLEYFMVKKIYAGKWVNSREVFMSGYIALAYSSVLWWLAA